MFYPQGASAEEVKRMEKEVREQEQLLAGYQQENERLYKELPGSDAVLHMSRIEFNELSSCEVRRLNQFETADIIRIGSAVLHAWLSRE